jgi:hypothetical protein
MTKYAIGAALLVAFTAPVLATSGTTTTTTTGGSTTTTVQGGAKSGQGSGGNLGHWGGRWLSHWRTENPAKTKPCGVSDHPKHGTRRFSVRA